MANPPEAIVAEFIASKLECLTYGHNIRWGSPDAYDHPRHHGTKKAGYVPIEVVFVWRSGGGPFVPCMGHRNCVTAGSRPEFYTIQVRSEKGDYSGGSCLAQDVYDAIAENAPPGFYMGRSLTAAPIYLGTDSYGSHRWQMDMELSRSIELPK